MKDRIPERLIEPKCVFEIFTKGSHGYYQHGNRYSFESAVEYAKSLSGSYKQKACVKLDGKLKACFGEHGERISPEYWSE